MKEFNLTSSYDYLDGTAGLLLLPLFLGASLLVLTAHAAAIDTVTEQQAGPSQPEAKPSAASLERSFPAIDRIAAAGEFWRKEARKLAKTNTLIGAEAVACLAASLARDDQASMDAFEKRVDVCLYVLQLQPGDGSIPLLNKLSSSKYCASIPDGRRVRVEAFAATCAQAGGKDYVRLKLDGDDQTRAAAICALTRGLNAEEITRLLSELRQRKTDFTGTETGTAMAQAQYVVDITQHLGKMAFEGQVSFLLGRPPYEALPPPDKPRLAREPDSIFEWNRLVSLWNQDPSRVRKAAEAYKAASPQTAEMVNRLLNDLAEEHD
jgi:hypothetical protein